MRFFWNFPRKILDGVGIFICIFPAESGGILGEISPIRLSLEFWKNLSGVFLAFFKIFWTHSQKKPKNVRSTL